MPNEAKTLRAIATLILVASATSCGEKSVPPPESPAAVEQPDGPPITNGVDAGALEQHTMPDGSVMPGHEHDGTAPDSPP